MPTKTLNISSVDQNIDINKVLEIIKSIFDSFQIETKSSKELLKLGIETSLTKIIRRAMENPMGELQANIERLNKAYLEIQSFIYNNLFGLTPFKEMTTKIFLEKNTKDSLVYHIILKENTLENRGQIRKLLNNYNDSENASSFPVFLQFLDIKTYRTIKKAYSNPDRFLRIDSQGAHL